jgi:hypothetical protein
VSNSWNLKARLLDLINVLSGEENLTVTWETCTEAECEDRVRDLTLALMPPPENVHSGTPASRQLPGLQLREILARRSA